MRWSYKTVHYELQKEGLLGSTFLDESEVEKSLNEYGKAGWELVSIMETMDGLIAVFKQPLSYNDEVYSSRPKEMVAVDFSPVDDEVDEEDQTVQEDKEPATLRQSKTVQQDHEVSEREPADYIADIDELIDEEQSADVGSIRIE